MTDHPKLREMSGAELKSMLKSSTHFKSLGGIHEPGLRLGEEDLAWWRGAKLGMFIHWGLYSMLGRGEWVMHNEKIPAEEYAGLAREFNPQGFDAGAWAGLARDAGMNYMVMVARHHDGFALWDSPGSHLGFDSMRSATKRDFVKEYAEACRGAGLRVGLYYSPMDWRFPGYFQPKELLDNALLMKKQCHDQVEELVSRYGPIDILWYDGAWLAHKGSDPDGAWLWDPVALNRMVRRHNPKTVINPRSGWEGDFYCDEGSHEITGKIIPVPWEKNLCICSGRSWGWIPDDPVMELPDAIRMLVNVFVRDGNVLLNVGPDRDGVIPAGAAERLRQIGQWMGEHAESVYGTRGGPIEPVDGVYGTTCKGSTVYLHVLDTARFAGMALPALPQTVLRVRTLDGSEVPFTQDDNGVAIEVRERCREIDTVIALELDGPARAEDKEGIVLRSK